jgi:hypothetical protein
MVAAVRATPDQALSSRPLEADPIPPIRLTNLVWVAFMLGVLVLAIESGQHWFLNYVHVMSGAVWSGIDLFLGFVLGPIIRALPLEARREVACRLMPRTLFIMPTLAVMTGTAGWFLAQQGGYLDLAYPEFYWVAAALVITAALTVEGLGILLPTNLIVYLELRKPAPDGARIARWMQHYVIFVAIQGCMQLAIIVVMAHLVTGL